MKLNKILLVSILLLTIISLGTVCAQDNLTSEIGNNWDFDDLNTLSEVSKDINVKDSQTTNIDDEKLASSNEGIVGEMGSDNVTVDVSNVYNGRETTISVTAPEATGTVNITVGEKTYSPEFIGGVATQIISEYNVGLNNVTVKYYDIVKETSFKALDGVITNETFADYYEYATGYYNSGGTWARYELYKYIPEGAVLDYRGLINASNAEGIFNRASGLTVISSTKDAIIYGNIVFGNSNSISDINVTGAVSIWQNSNLSNSNVGKLRITYGGNIDNVTVKRQTILDQGNNISISNSNLLGGVTSDSFSLINYIVIKNCIVYDNLFCNNSSFNNGGIIEGNIINGDVYMRGHKFIVRNNTITGSGSTYAIYATDSAVITNNTVYNYDYNYAIRCYNEFTVVNNTLFSNNFGDNAVKIGSGYPSGIVIENNTPGQIPLRVTNTKNILYDGDVAIDVNVNATGNVIVDVNGKKYDLKLINGNANLIINEYHSGNNVIRVYYSDVANDIYGFARSTFYVEKVDSCPVELIYSNATVGKAAALNVVLPYDANGLIEVKISNSTHTITTIQNANGSKNMIYIPDLSEGTYLMNVVFTSDKYVTNSSSANIIFVHEPVYNLNANNVVMDYKDGSKYKVLVTEDGNVVVGEVVKVTFNGKTSEIKTDNSGYASLTLDGAPKTYAIVAEYNGVTKSSKVTIKNVLKASNISKKKAKSIKFSATLKTSKGKAIVGKKITFKLKGKTYAAKTNKKGVATITLKNLKVGKYTITSKYGACTGKNTIKIKK